MVLENRVFGSHKVDHLLLFIDMNTVLLNLPLASGQLTRIVARPIDIGSQQVQVTEESLFMSPNDATILKHMYDFMDLLRNSNSNSSQYQQPANSSTILKHTLIHAIPCT
jgi:hypothetical protein